jgi:hypothetical protein
MSTINASGIVRKSDKFQRLQQQIPSKPDPIPIPFNASPANPLDTEVPDNFHRNRPKSKARKPKLPMAKLFRLLEILVFFIISTRIFNIIPKIPDINRRQVDFLEVQRRRSFISSRKTGGLYI